MRGSGFTRRYRFGVLPVSARRAWPLWLGGAVPLRRIFVKLLRRIAGLCLALGMAAALSGCIIVPLHGWGHGHEHGHEGYGYDRR